MTDPCSNDHNLRYHEQGAGLRSEAAKEEVPQPKLQRLVVILNQKRPNSMVFLRFRSRTMFLLAVSVCAGLCTVLGLPFLLQT